MTTVPTLTLDLSNGRVAMFVQETFVGNDYEDDFLLQDFMIPMQHVAAAVKIRESHNKNPALICRKGAIGRVHPRYDRKRSTRATAWTTSG